MLFVLKGKKLSTKRFLSLSKKKPGDKKFVDLILKNLSKTGSKSVRLRRKLGKLNIVFTKERLSKTKIYWSLHGGWLLDLQHELWSLADHR